MAISAKDCSILFYSTTLGVSFEKTVMLGRLQLVASKKEVEACVEKYRANSFDLSGEVSSPDGYAEPLFKILGATQIDSLDHSNYEGATIIQDMNLAVDKSLHSQFTALVDGGTLEHIFNFPIAIANCMNMIRVGGHFIGVSPANNQMGHGFYQFSPELFYRVFCRENGFEVKKMFITPTEAGSFYEVADPFAVKSRVMLANNQPLAVIVIAQKIEDKLIFKLPPQQSDYQMVWSINQSLKKNEQIADEGKIKFLYRKFFPRPLKIIVRYLYDFIFLKEIKSDELGVYNSSHFKKTDI